MGRKKKAFEKFEYDKQQLFDILNKISIVVSDGFTKVLASGKTVQSYKVTTFFNKQIVKEVDVSQRYEVFDFTKFAIDAIEKLEKSFNITHYSYLILGGIQEFRLYSDAVTINGKKFYKTFYLLNSSDRTRVVNLDFGLYCEDSDYHFISKAPKISKRHYNGITEHVNENLDFKSDEIFDQQIDILKEMGDNNIRFSKIREVVLDAKDGSVNSSNHTKFDIYKKKLLSLYDSKQYFAPSNTPLTRDTLCKFSTEMDAINWDKYDITFNCLDVFEKYVSIYSTRDSAVIKKESESFLKMTEFYVREQKLKDLLAMLEENND